MHDIIQELLRHEGNACLSLFVPTGYASFADRAKSELNLKKALKEAERILEMQASQSVRRDLLQQVTILLKGVDLNHPPKGLACFVTEGYAELMRLPFAVEQKVVFSDTFELQDVLYHLDQMVRYQVLHLSKGCTRFFRGVGPSLEEFHNDDFPRSFQGEYQTEKPSPHTLYTVDPSSVQGKRLEEFFRGVHRAAGGYRDGSPLVLMGVERDVVLYKKLFSGENFFAGCVYGNYDRGAVHEVQGLVWPLIAAEQGRKEDSLLQRIATTVSGGGGVYGLSALLPLINLHHHATSLHLVVEKEYEVAGFFEASSGSLNLEASLLTAGAREVPNLVAHVIERVLCHPKGRVTMVKRGGLKQFGHIVLLTS